MARKSIRPAQAYEKAFEIGGVGSIFLILFTLFGDVLVGLMALAIWCIITLFVLPWLYIVVQDKVPHVPDWFLRGPHQ